jgi:hypothetical protein
MSIALITLLTCLAHIPQPRQLQPGASVLGLCHLYRHLYSTYVTLDRSADGRDAVLGVVRHSSRPALLYVSPPFPLVHVLPSLSDSTRHLSRKTSTYPWVSTRHPRAWAGYHFSMVLVTEIYSVTLGQAVAELSPTIMVAPLSSQSLFQLVAQLATMLTTYSRSRLPSRPLPPSHLLPLLRCHNPQGRPSLFLEVVDVRPRSRHEAHLDLVSTELHQLPVRYLESEFKVCPDCFPSISFEKLVS